MSTATIERLASTLNSNSDPEQKVGALTQLNQELCAASNATTTDDNNIDNENEHQLGNNTTNPYEQVLENAHNIIPNLKLCLRNANSQVSNAALSCFQTLIPLLPSVPLILQVVQLLGPNGFIDRLGNDKNKDSATSIVLSLANSALEFSAVKTPDSPWVKFEDGFNKYGLCSKIARVKVQCLNCFAKLRSGPNPSAPIKPFLSNMLTCLEDADQTVRGAAKEAIITVFTHPSVSPAAHADLKKELGARDIRKSTQDTILTSVFTRPPSSTTSQPSTPKIKSTSSPAPSRSSRPPSRAAGNSCSTPLRTKSTPSKPAKKPYIVASAKDVSYDFSKMRPAFEGDESEDNWKSREASMNKIKEMLQSDVHVDYPDEFLEEIKLIIDGIVKALKSLRTSLSTSAITLVSELALNLGTSVDPVSETLFTTLLGMAGMTKKLTANAAQQAAHDLIVSVPFHTKTLQLLEGSIKDKNKETRSHAVAHVKAFFDTHLPHNKHLFEGHNGLHYVEEILVKVVSDPIQPVRERGREIYWDLVEIFPQVTDSVMGRLDPTTQKGLQRANPKGSSATAAASSGVPAASNLRTRPSVKDMIEKRRKEAAAAAAASNNNNGNNNIPPLPTSTSTSSSTSFSSIQRPPSSASRNPNLSSSVPARRISSSSGSSRPMSATPPPPMKTASNTSSTELTPKKRNSATSPQHGSPPLSRSNPSSPSGTRVRPASMHGTISQPSSPSSSALLPRSSTPTGRAQHRSASASFDGLSRQQQQQQQRPNSRIGSGSGSRSMVSPIHPASDSKLTSSTSSRHVSSPSLSSIQKEKSSNLVKSASQPGGPAATQRRRSSLLSPHSSSTDTFAPINESAQYHHHEHKQQQQQQQQQKQQQHASNSSISSSDFGFKNDNSIINDKNNNSNNTAQAPRTPVRKQQQTATSSVSAGLSPEIKGLPLAASFSDDEVVEDAMRAQAEQAESTAERLLELVEPEFVEHGGSDPLPTAPPLGPGGVLQNQDSLTRSSRPLFASQPRLDVKTLFSDSPNANPSDMLNKNVSLGKFNLIKDAWWAKRAEFLSRGPKIPDDQESQHDIVKKTIESLVSDQDLDTNLILQTSQVCLARPCGGDFEVNDDDAHNESPTKMEGNGDAEKLNKQQEFEQNEQFWAQGRLFDELLTSLFALLQKQKTNVTNDAREYCLVLLRDTLLNQLTLTSGHEIELIDVLLLLKTDPTKNINAGSEAIMALFVNSVDALYGLSCLRTALEGLTHKTHNGIQVDVDVQDGLIKSEALALRSLGSLFERVPGEIVEEELAKARSFIQIAINDPKHAELRQAAVSVLAAAQHVIRDESKVFETVGPFNKSQVALLTYYFAK